MNRITKSIGAFALVTAISSTAFAGGSKQYPLSASYKDECGSCHVAFPPSLLSREAWRAVMNSLDKHFGTDASMETAAAQKLGDYLAANAGNSERYTAQGRDLPYMTRTAWFRKEHRSGHDGLSDSIWTTPAVKSPANCGACHRSAATGDYSERDIRLPK